MYGDPTMSYYELQEVGRRMERSHEYDAIFAHRLRREGFGLYLPFPRLREETESRRPFEDSVDVVVFGPGKAGVRKELVIELKSKNVEFDTPESWPFPDVTCYNANKTCTPYAVLFYSIPTDHVLAVVHDESWFKGEQTDGDPARNGLRYQAVKAPLSALLTWGEFVERMWVDLTGTRRECRHPGPDIPREPRAPHVPEVFTDDDVKALLEPNGSVTITR